MRWIHSSAWRLSDKVLEGGVSMSGYGSERVEEQPAGTWLLAVFSDSRTAAAAACCTWPRQSAGLFRSCCTPHQSVVGSSPSWWCGVVVGMVCCGGCGVVCGAPLGLPGVPAGVTHSDPPVTASVLMQPPPGRHHHTKERTPLSELHSHTPALAQPKHCNLSFS